MSRNLNFSFPLATLLQAGDSICDAAETHAAELADRLSVADVAATRKLLGQVSASDAGQKTGAGSVGTLTKEQNAKLADLQEQLTRARDTAKRAFKGNDVKLREEFQVGINKPNDLASVLQRARVVLTGCQPAGNAAALQAKGWLAADTTALSAAIAALDASDDSQETAKAAKTGTTAQRNAQANELYERLLTIQNAANLQWPARAQENTTVRAEFRLGAFPPKQEPKKKTDAKRSDTTTTPPTPNP